VCWCRCRATASPGLPPGHRKPSAPASALSALVVQTAVNSTSELACSAGRWKRATGYPRRWRQSGPAESCLPYRPPWEIHKAVAVSWPQLVTSGNFFPRPHSPGEWLFVSEGVSQKFHLSVKRITLLTDANGYPFLRLTYKFGSRTRPIPGRGRAFSWKRHSLHSCRFRWRSR
jgi:hypothetical protein